MMIGGCVVLCFGILIFIQLINVRNNSYDQAVILAKETSQSHAKNLTGELEVIMTTLKNTQNYVAFGAKTKALNREQIIELLKGTLAKTPSILAEITESLLKAIDIVSASANTGADSTSSIAEHSSTIYQQFEEVVTQAKNAKKYAEELNQILNQFKI
jgi:methyl-accepting chemotaxis protein